MPIERVHTIIKEDWAFSIEPGTPVTELVRALLDLPPGLVVQKDYTRAISNATIIAFERRPDDAAS